MAKIFPVGTRFLTSSGYVAQVTHYSTTEVRAYCEHLCDTKILTPTRGKRGGLALSGGNLKGIGNDRTPYFVELRSYHIDRVVQFPSDETPDALNHRMLDANEKVKWLRDEARRLREQADALEQQARDETYQHLDINLD